MTTSTLARIETFNEFKHRLILSGRVVRNHHGAWTSHPCDEGGARGRCRIEDCNGGLDILGLYAGYRWNVALHEAGTRVADLGGDIADVELWNGAFRHELTVLQHDDLVAHLAAITRSRLREERETQRKHDKEGT